MDKKEKQLGMNPGTAAYRLRRGVLFRAVQELSWDTCFQCGEKIEDIDNFSIEHKIPWLDSDDPVGLFFDLDNIAFSHRSCNYAAKRYNSETQVARGESHGRSKLRKEDILEIRRLYETSKVTQRQLASMFQTGLMTINHIINRNTWQHI